MKLRLRRHTTLVLTGAEAREWIRDNEPFKLSSGASAVALCACGWRQTELHGEAAEKAALAHGGTPQS